MFRFCPSSVFAGLINIFDELLMFDIVKLLCSAANSDSWIITGPTFSNGMERNTQQLLFLTNVFVLFVNNRRLNIATEWACYHSVPSSLYQWRRKQSLYVWQKYEIRHWPSFFLLFIEKSKQTRLCPGEHKFEASKKEKKYFFCRNTDRTSKHLPSLIVLVVSVDVKKHWTLNLNKQLKHADENICTFPTFLRQPRFSFQDVQKVIAHWRIKKHKNKALWSNMQVLPLLWKIERVPKKWRKVFII